MDPEYPADKATLLGSAESSPKRLLIIAASCLLLILSAFLHFWNLDNVPPGFYRDESSITYNAYSIAETGADEYGRRMPLFFRAFDNYHDPVMVYSTVPLVKIFGLVKWAGRSVSGFYFLLASLAFGFLVFEHTRNHWLSIVSGFVFSVTPWGFALSRGISAGYTPMLLGLVLGHLCFIRAFRLNSLPAAIAAGLSYAFAMYAHNIGRPMAALYICCLFIAFLPAILKKKRLLLAFILSFVLALTPLIISVLQSASSLTTRFSTISVWSNASGIKEVLHRIFSRYLDYFDPKFLFYFGDSNLRHHTGMNGELFVLLIPLILVGLAALIKNIRRQPQARFILLALLFYPAAAVLTIDRMHSTRCLNGMIYWLLIAATGASFLAALQWRLKTFVLLLVGMLGTGEMTLYLADYFNSYPERARPYFRTVFTESLQDAFSTLKKNEILSISQSAFYFNVRPDFKPVYYVDLLFFGKIAPAAYQQHGIPENLVRLYDPDNSTPPGLLLRRSPYLRPLNNKLSLFSNREKLPAGSLLLSSRHDSIGTTYEIYRIPAVDNSLAE